jgi:hypothetical protein
MEGRGPGVGSSREAWERYIFLFCYDLVNLVIDIHVA